MIFFLRFVEPYWKLMILFQYHGTHNPISEEPSWQNQKVTFKQSHKSANYFPEGSVTRHFIYIVTYNNAKII